MKELRVGLVGLGNRGLNGWLDTFKAVKRAKVVAVCDKVQELVNQGLQRTNDPVVKGYVDFEKMLKEAGIDVVAIVVEPENQPELIFRSLEAGKHVVCEVPLTFDLEACGQIVKAVEKSGLKFCMAEQMSFHPFTRAWKKLSEEGKLGHIVYAEGQYLHGMGEDRLWHDVKTGRRVPRAEAKNNPNVYKSRAWNMKHPIWYLPHEFGPFLRILEDQVTTVTCLSTRRPSYHYEELPLPDIEVAIMKTRKDTIIREACGFCMPTARPFHWYHLLGTKGEVETPRTGSDDYQEPGKWWVADNYMNTRQEMKWEFTHYQTGVTEAGATGHGGLDFYPLQDFVEAVHFDRKPVVDVYRAAEISAIGICAGISAEKNGELVNVPDFRKSR